MRLYLIFIAYFFFAYLIVKRLPRQLQGINKIFKIMLLSFLYALFFGIGIIGTGGDPGFGFPAPIILAFFAIEPNLYLAELDFLAFWWILIFLVIFIRDRYKSKQALSK